MQLSLTRAWPKEEMDQVLLRCWYSTTPTRRTSPGGSLDSWLLPRCASVLEENRTSYECGRWAWRWRNCKKLQQFVRFNVPRANVILFITMRIKSPADQLLSTIEIETSKRQRKKKERNQFFSIGFAGFGTSSTTVKHRNIDYKDARRGNMVVVDVRSTMNSNDCLLSLWEKTIFHRHHQQETK